MSDEVELRQATLAARYDLARQAEWRKLTTHFDLAEGFALVVLMTLDAEGADWCRLELARHLQSQGKTLAAIELPSPSDLRQLPAYFMDTRLNLTDAGLWVAAVAPDYAKNYGDWRAAWAQTLARLNAYRNPIRSKFKLTVILVGAPWLQVVMREMAPDLWSVRTLVVRIEPLVTFALESASTLTNQANPLPPGREINGTDPEFALQLAEKLRGVQGKELALANLLHRAGDGFANKLAWDLAEKSYGEALDLKRKYNAALASLTDSMVNLGSCYFATGQIQRATKLYDAALVISRSTADRPLEGNLLGNLASSYFELGDLRRARGLAHNQLEIARAIKDRKMEGDALGILGNVFLRQGDVRQAIDLFDQELAIAIETNYKIGECSALGNLGAAYGALGDYHKAIALEEQALVLAMQAGHPRLSIIILNFLGMAFRNLGQVQKAVEYYDQALELARKGGNRSLEINILGNLGKLV